MVERLIFDGPDIFLADLNMQKKRGSEVAIMQLSFGMKNNSFSPRRINNINEGKSYFYTTIVYFN